MPNKKYRPMDIENIPAEEKDLELEASKDVKEEEIRSSIVTEFGFDEVDDKEKIDKLVAKEVDSRKKLSTAIGQKIKYREEAKTKGATPPKDDKAKESNALTAEDIDKRLEENLQKRDLDEMPHSKEIKEEIKRVAQIRGVSVKEAARDPYIVNKIEDEKKAQEADEAAIKRKNNQGGTKTFTDTPPDVDMNTEEGRKTWDSWKEWAKSKGL